MSYYRGEATIVQGDRRIAVSHCHIDLDTDSRGLKGWWGNYNLAQAFDDPDTGEGTLELEDGRKGDVILTRVVASSGYGEFRGTGPPPS